MVDSVIEVRRDDAAMSADDQQAPATYMPCTSTSTCEDPLMASEYVVEIFNYMKQIKVSFQMPIVSFSITHIVLANDNA